MSRSVGTLSVPFFPFGVPPRDAAPTGLLSGSGAASKFGSLKASSFPPGVPSTAAASTVLLSGGGAAQTFSFESPPGLAETERPEIYRNITILVFGRREKHKNEKLGTFVPEGKVFEQILERVGPSGNAEAEFRVGLNGKEYLKVMFDARSSLERAKLRTTIAVDGRELRICLWNAARSKSPTDQWILHSAERSFELIMAAYMSFGDMLPRHQLEYGHASVAGSMHTTSAPPSAPPSEAPVSAPPVPESWRISSGSEDDGETDAGPARAPTTLVLADLIEDKNEDNSPAAAGPKPLAPEDSSTADARLYSTATENDATVAGDKTAASPGEEAPEQIPGDGGQEWAAEVALEQPTAPGAWQVDFISFRGSQRQPSNLGPPCP